MKNRSMFILVGLLGAFFLSVNAYSYTPYEKFVKHEMSYSLSKSVTMENDFAFSPFTMDPFHVDYHVALSCARYKVGELNNKALPLSKKLWLMNCQIALK